MQWLRDNLGLIRSAPEIEALARDRRRQRRRVLRAGVLRACSRRTGGRTRAARSSGLTRFVNKGHIARAALEATAFQTREVLDAMNADSGVPLDELKVDGGMIANDLLMQFQADILGVPVVRPVVAETTALGAAYAAGLAVGFWARPGRARANWREDRRWAPQMDAAERDRLLRNWKKAVTSTFDWVDKDVS